MAQDKENVTIQKTDHLASEVLKHQHDKSTAKNVGLFAGMVLLTIVTAISIISGANERKHLVELNYQNDCEWRALFADYDFISQDGGGINNVNGGEQGDLNNGATGENP